MLCTTGYTRNIIAFHLLCASLLPFLVPVPAKAQSGDKYKGFAIEANLMAGRLFKHTQNFRGPIPDLSTAVELNLVQQTYGRKDWEQRRHYPLIGLGFTYTGYGIDSLYGRCISVYPDLQLSIVRGKRLEWTFRFGFGLGYLTRHYERSPSWDTLNNAIGSHFNNYTTMVTDLRWRVNSHLDLQAGLNFSHSSNAALRQPNLGINMYGAHIGIRYFPVSAQPEKIARVLQPLKNRWLGQARLGIAFNETGAADGPLFPVYLVSLYASRRWQSRNKLFAGLDYSYHRDIEAFLKNNEIFTGEEKKHSWKSAVFAGNEFLFGRVGVMLQLGFYIKEAALRLDPFYEKLGANFYLLQREQGPVKEVFASILLKTHKAQAELAELGLGIGF